MSLTLEELSVALKATLHGDPATLIEGVATLGNAGPGSLGFFSNRRYHQFLRETRASAVILAEADREECPVATLVMDNPYLGYAQAATLLNPEPVASPGVHASASVHGSAHVDSSAHIGANAVVAEGSRIGAGCYVGPGSVILEQASVGEQCWLGANVTLCRGVQIGKRVRLHPGVVIGADGFGIANNGEAWIKVPQLGSVIIGDDVEIGANTTIDRGALEDTVLEEGVKLDNLVQVGHNVHIGAHTAVAGCAAIAGSAHIGKRCTIGGAAAIGGHLEIADDVHLTATSGVPNSITKPGVYSSGVPIQENKIWRRNVIRMLHLEDMAKRIKALERKLK